MLKDDTSADLADWMKRPARPTMRHSKENEVEIQTVVAPSEIWLREDLEKVYALLFRYVGIGTRLALCSVAWLPTPEFVVLVPDPIGFAPWSDSCQGQE